MRSGPSPGRSATNSPASAEPARTGVDLPEMGRLGFETVASRPDERDALLYSMAG